MPLPSKTAPRRDLKLRSLDELAAELDRIDAAIAAGTLGSTADWSPGQIMDHLTKFMRAAIDGFSGTLPLPIRLLGRWVFRPRALGEAPIPSGIKLPKNAAEILPDDEVSPEEGLARLRAQVARLHAGERMTHPSPLMGPLTHDEWVHLQLKHCDLHLSFLTGLSTPSSRSAGS